VLPALAVSRRPHRVLAILLAAWASWLLAAPARALEVRLSTPRERGGYVYVAATVRDPFGERVGESLLRGMPATLELKAELWRKRSGWFDRLESGYQARVRVQYEAWSDEFRIEGPRGQVIMVGTLDSTATMLSLPWALPVGRVGALVPSAHYYVVVNAILKPLSVEDVAEVEGWLSGEAKAQGGAGLGVITELPRSLFDAVRNFAGFGDHRRRAVSGEFELRDLFPNAP
jgi:hypothetical protein